MIGENRGIGNQALLILKDYNTRYYGVFDLEDILII